MKRRHFITGALLTGSASFAAMGAKKVVFTPSEIEGPFYPVIPQADTDADLTQVEGKRGLAKGEVIRLFGQVRDQHLQPVSSVSIEMWQANSDGKYHHPHDTSSKPVDENFQSWAILQSNMNGEFRVKTVMPGAYPLPDGRTIRTPHIHFKISKPGYSSLLTQMYFPNHPLNSTDPLIKRRTARETALMTANKVATASDEDANYQWNVVLEKL